jgi:hypothetical protein
MSECTGVPGAHQQKPTRDMRYSDMESEIARLNQALLAAQVSKQTAEICVDDIPEDFWDF